MMLTETTPSLEWPLVLNLGPLMTDAADDAFFEFCQANRDLRIEREPGGEIALMPPAGGESGNVEYRLAWLFGNWAEADGSGVGFSSSTGFRLPNGAVRSPDLAWVARARWDALAPKQRKRFPPLCPDFVAEVRSPYDALPALHAKMQEWLDNGARLAWLVDPAEKKVYVYRPGAEVEVIAPPTAVSGDPVLPGFALDLDRLWP